MEPKKNPSKDVHRYSGHFFLTGLCISIALLIMAFQLETRKRIPPAWLPPPPDLLNSYQEVPVIIPEVPVEPPPPGKIIQIDLSRLTETPDNFEIPEITEPTVETIPAPAPPAMEVIPAYEPVKDTFIVVEKMPVPLGGYQAFYKSLSKAITYPHAAKRSSTEGRVFVEFVINQLGQAVNFKVIKGIGSGCDEEAIRVLSSTEWEPGKQRGRPVNVKMVLPVTFKLN
jgi:protein TonB